MMHGSFSKTDRYSAPQCLNGSYSPPPRINRRRLVFVAHADLAVLDRCAINLAHTIAAHCSCEEDLNLLTEHSHLLFLHGGRIPAQEQGLVVARKSFSLLQNASRALAVPLGLSPLDCHTSLSTGLVQLAQPNLPDSLHLVGVENSQERQLLRVELKRPRRRIIPSRMGHPTRHCYLDPPSTTVPHPGTLGDGSGARPGYALPTRSSLDFQNTGNSFLTAADVTQAVRVLFERARSAAGGKG
jgi:hypothetical protein